MAGAACKVVINNGVQGLVSAVERILTEPFIHAGRLEESERLELLQDLANIDIAIYTGDTSLMPEGGLSAIVQRLEESGLITDEVWQVYNRESMLSLDDSKDQNKKE